MTVKFDQIAKSNAMTLDFWRARALEAARSILRERGEDPATVTAEDALGLLEDRIRALSYADSRYWVKWVRYELQSPSERQGSLFCREWDKWKEAD